MEVANPFIPISKCRQHHRQTSFVVSCEYSAFDFVYCLVGSGLSSSRCAVTCGAALQSKNQEIDVLSEGRCKRLASKRQYLIK